MSQCDLVFYPKLKLRHCDLYFMISDFTSYFEDCLMYKHDILFFIHLFLFEFFFLFTLYRYCCSRMIKVTDLEYFIFIAFTFKFDVKSLLAEGDDTGRG